ncbi:hypothetical protein GCM10011499_28190 [Pelagibacterium lentulum]|uniref:Uncharacterized protein n=2 Tax=Pelagibacterium lentulum TaxID=2029865 RepID=A0A916W022_9HYPH|nr:hypothetical protein GCM10011499_28190 [Pelagibacterium lentulum]
MGYKAGKSGAASRKCFCEGQENALYNNGLGRTFLQRAKPRLGIQRRYMNISSSSSDRPNRILRRLGAFAMLAGMSLGLAACTTIEGTNALSDPMTFEREVLRSTLSGVGIIDQETRDPLVAERGPLVVPASGAVPPPPQQRTASLPQDSSRVVVDPTGLTDADLRLLQQGRVVGSGVASGRPLTDAETRQLAARMAAYRRAQGMTERNIYLPPEDYFARVGNQSLVCLAPNGDLVSISDPSCPPEVRAQLGAN